MTAPLAAPLLDDLRQLDPAPPVDLTPAQVGRRDALLVRVTSAEHPLAPVPNRSRRRRMAVGLTAAAALAIAAIIVSAVPGLTHAPVSSYALPAHGSLASWTPQTTAATYTPDDVNSCVSQLGFSGSDQVPVVLTSDKRGDFTSLFVEQGANDGNCVLAGGAVENLTNFEGLVSHPLDDPNAAVISVMQGGSWMFVVSGHAGVNVTSLSVKDPDTGENVAASIARGVWSAWWPVAPDSKAWQSDSQNEDYVDAISITYSTSDGQSHHSASITPGDDQPSDATPAGQPVLSELPGWSAETQAVVPSLADVDTCAQKVDGWPSGSATTLLAEKRGDFETLLLQRAGVNVSCVLKEGVVQ
ncbi:MAG: hypothetical protein JWQ19_1555 [Subtercola sp.]|nr:hypothetical protein [Subtercola sp.]